ECSNCHLLEKDAKRTGERPRRPGPRLWGVVGRKIASQEFAYTEAMIELSGSWTFEQLNAFLADPAGTVPGTEMFDGYVKNRTERIALIAYLRTMADDPIPLP
ncbi:MAG: c-type cytochrome, partial [Boseongicola sp.]